MTRGRPAGSQQGVVLVVALVMLLAVTLMVVMSSNLVQTNLKVVQNLESRQMARSAALAALDQAISSGSAGGVPRFIQFPNSMFTVPCPGKGTNDLCYDVNHDGTNDVTVTVAAPTCTSVSPTPNSKLDVFGSVQQASCYLPPAVYSMCAYAVWDFQATATDPATGAQVKVRQGVSVLSSLNKIETVCPTT